MPFIHSFCENMEQSKQNEFCFGMEHKLAEQQLIYSTTTHTQLQLSPPSKTVFRLSAPLHTWSPKRATNQPINEQANRKISCRKRSTAALEAKLANWIFELQQNSAFSKFDFFFNFVFLYIIASLTWRKDHWVSGDSLHICSVHCTFVTSNNFINFWFALLPIDNSNNIYVGKPIFQIFWGFIRECPALSYWRTTTHEITWRIYKLLQVSSFICYYITVSRFLTHLWKVSSRRILQGEYPLRKVSTVRYGAFSFVFRNYLFTWTRNIFWEQKKTYHTVPYFCLVELESCCFYPANQNCVCKKGKSWHIPFWRLHSAFTSLEFYWSLFSKRSL